MRLFVLLPFFTSALCFNFNIKDVTEIRANGITEDSYFGYALLLQKGTQGFSPKVIVGSPGQGSGKSGGSVHSCSKESICTKYGITTSNAYSFNGNFLGSVLDGGEKAGELFVTCAPRVVKAIPNEHNFLNGLCFFQSNTSNPHQLPREIYPFKNLNDISRLGSHSYYDYAFGQAGFAMKYLQDINSLLLGAPGVKTWNGVLVVYYLSTNGIHIIPERVAPFLDENFEFLGYQVTTARFYPNSRIAIYVVGAPRGNGLRGSVKIFSPQGRLMFSLTGSEIGSYYGSSLLGVDLNNDRRDDILVGAPTGAGSSWDEGYVYFYRNTRTKLDKPEKLVGNRKAGARFGSSIVSLGDIDLDSFNDVAISAPFEDDGVGAVYIYRGSGTGIQTTYSQRLSPLDFSGGHPNVRGFGQGLSKGVDVDGNGHNDLAIGAYKSNEVFLLRTLSVIDYTVTLETNLTSVHAGGMNVKYCVHFTQRSPVKNLKSIQFNLRFLVDYRVDGSSDFNYTLKVPSSTNPYCQSTVIIIRKSPLDITPFKLSLKSEILEDNIIGIGENTIKKSIPYSHGCGIDNICQTSILLEAIPSLSDITLGLNKEVTMVVSAQNIGEPGYNCELFMNFSNVLELRNFRDCILENSTYICPFSSQLENMTKEVPFTFDLKPTTPKLKNVSFSFEIKCLGVNFPADANKREITLNVSLRNSPYIQGSSIPENFYYTDNNLKREVSHKFQVRNFGPSPLSLDVFLAVPMIKLDGIDIFDIDAKGSLNGIEVQCNPTNRTFQLERTSEPLNKTIVIDCLEENVDCMILFCDGDYLYKSIEIAEYTIKITTNTKLLSTHYRSELLKKGILSYISSAYIFNATNRVDGHVATMIFASKSKPVPMWVWIAAGIVGVILLALVIFLLYKCHFFDRNYRDKLNEEKLIEQRMDENVDSMDPVALQDLSSDT